MKKLREEDYLPNNESCSQNLIVLVVTIIVHDVAVVLRLKEYK